MEWSKDIASKEHISEGRLKRWKKFWKPYKNLPEDIKDYDRVWAEKVLDHVPIKCPIWQCGGFMDIKEGKPNRRFEGDDQDSQSWQCPDMVCVNCGAKYKFGGFKRRRERHSAQPQK